MNRDFKEPTTATAASVSVFVKSSLVCVFLGVRFFSFWPAFCCFHRLLPSRATVLISVTVTSWRQHKRGAVEVAHESTMTARSCQFQIFACASVLWLVLVRRCRRTLPSSIQNPWYLTGNDTTSNQSMFVFSLRSWWLLWTIAISQRLPKKTSRIGARTSHSVKCVADSSRPHSSEIIPCVLPPLARMRAFRVGLGIRTLVRMDWGVLEAFTHHLVPVCPCGRTQVETLLASYVVMGISIERAAATKVHKRTPLT